MRTTTTPLTRGVGLRLAVSLAVGVPVVAPALSRPPAPPRYGLVSSDTPVDQEGAMMVPLRATINLGFALGFLILLVVGIASYQTIRGLILLGEQISHTQAVEDNLEATLALVTDAETGQRGFLLTGDESYLAPYTSAIRSADAKLAALRALTSDSPEDQQKIDTLQSLIMAKHAELQETIELRRAQGIDAALAIVQTNRGKNTMDAIRATVGSLEYNENAVLQQRNAELAADAQRTITIIVIGSVVGIVLVGAAILLINYGLSARQRAEDERKRLLVREQAARTEAEAARTRVTTILESISDAFFALDTEWRYTYVNQRAAQTLGRTPADLLGRNIWDVYPDSVGTTFDREYQRAVAEQTPVHFEEYYAPFDGWYEFHAYPSVDGLSVYIQDVTERKRAEEERERHLAQAQIERARFEAILESAASAIIYLDKATGHITFNQGAVHLFGHALIPENGIDQFASQVYHANGEPISVKELPSQRALQGEATPEQEMDIAQPDSRRIPVLESDAPVRAPDGSVIGAVIVLQDISALKDLEHLREEWTSVVAHDLRQPVTLIIGYGGMLTKQVETMAPQLVKPVENILTSAHRLNRMIGDLLDVSRLEARRLQLERQDVDVVALTSEIVERLSSITTIHPVRVHVDGEIPLLAIDPQRFEQILGNLLSNAVKYGDPNAEIVVRLQRRDGEARVSVTNQGEGIAPDSLSQLFTRFHRVGEGRGRRVGGLGLGLYITKGLVEAHGGRIWAESVPGESTTFSFVLPLDC